MLGQSRLAEDIVRRMLVPGARVVLEGPSGSGKSTLARLVASRLADVGRVIPVSGNANQAGTKFLAMHRALAGSRPRRPLREAVQSEAPSPLRLLPVIGGTAASFARIAIASLGPAKPEFLSAEQQDILSGLQNMAAGRRAFLVVDDLGRLDPDSAQLLLCLSWPEVRNAFAFAAAISILFVETSDQAPTLTSALLDKLRPQDVVRCEPVSRQIFEAVLKYFGFPRDPDPQVLDELYAISRGHLEIAKQIAKLDRGEDLPAMLADGDATSLMSELLSSRLRDLQGADALGQLLSIAACAGTTFSEAEVRCAFADPVAFATALQAAYREELMSTDGADLRFSHEAIRAAAARLGSPDAPDLHARLAACVKTLRPGDYPARLRHTRLSGNAEGLHEIAFAVEMQAVRGERAPFAADPAEVGELAGVLEDAREGYRLMDAGHHRQAVELMMRHYDASVDLVQGEVAALVALNLIKYRTEDAYNRAASMLELWRERLDEPELWQRLMSILVTAWAFAGETERSSGLHAVLERALARAAQADPMARNRAEALNRKADQFCTSEIAVKHIERAVKWFGPAENADMPRHAFEYTAALVNLSGALFTFGEFEGATQGASTALRCMERLHGTGLRLVEPYKALNNYVIAAFRAGRETAQSSREALDALSSAEHDHMLDRSLVECNRGALMLLGGLTSAGLERLEAVWRHVEQAGLDDYYRLYAGSNLAVALALSKRKRNAAEMLAAVVPSLESTPKWVRQAHRRRHSLMRQALDDNSIDSVEAFDGYPALVRPPDGAHDPWWSIGRGLLLSDIQVWSEG